MKNMFDILQRISRIFSFIAGVALTFMMFLTVADVLLRAGGHPINGTYEVVALSLALVIGFSLPKVSLDRQQIYMDFLLEKLSNRNQAIMKTFTRILCIILFLLIGYNLFSIGNEFHSSGEVSPILMLPFFPITYSVGICCFIECFVFIFELLRIWGRHE